MIIVNIGIYRHPYYSQDTGFQVQKIIFHVDKCDVMVCKETESFVN